MFKWENDQKTIYGHHRMDREKEQDQAWDQAWESEAAHQGGRLLNQGLYGCVFMPSLTCQPGTEQVLPGGPYRAGLGKLIGHDDAEKEFAIAGRMARIPFYRQYFAVAETLCDPAAKRKQREQELARCGVLDKKVLGEMKLLSMPYAGRPLHHARFTAAFDLRAFVVHLVAGGALLNLFGVVHRDLHQGNVLVDDRHVPRIIDFNLAVSARGAHAAELSHTYEVGISQEPPDSTLVNAIAHGENALAVISAVAFQKPVIRKLGLVGVTAASAQRELMAFYQRSRAVRAGDLERWFTLHQRVIDSWAIGVMIVELITSLALWPTLAGKIQRALPALVPVLRRMCAVAPTERIDCVQALRLLDPQHVVIRRYAARWLQILDQTR